MSLREVYTQAKMSGHKKVAGEHSLTVGEIVFTILGVLCIFYGARANIPTKYRLPLGIAVIFMGEWIF
ncbi:hypothetical protein ES702_04507 [subsurface metagenome]